MVGSWERGVGSGELKWILCSLPFIRGWGGVKIYAVTQDNRSNTQLILDRVAIDLDRFALYMAIQSMYTLVFVWGCRYSLKLIVK
jgi:hypothetical protein